MNSLVDPEVIAALYRASQAGVKIELIVRGICCLRAGVPGVSENIRVISIIGRYLEHCRIMYFRNGGSEEVYLTSGDWMPRNLSRRVETMFPIDDADLKHRVVQDILALRLRDNVKARELRPDGRYQRVPVRRGQKRVDSQSIFMERALAEHVVAPEMPFSGEELTPVEHLTPEGEAFAALEASRPPAAPTPPNGVLAATEPSGSALPLAAAPVANDGQSPS
jgi:polyphosphate kinase